MCYSLYVVLDTDKFLGRFQRLLILNVCFGALSCFIAMTSSAAMIAEQVVELFSSLSIISANNGNASLLQKIIAVSQQGIALTVWRIIPITRSFMFGIIGMLLTYTVMVYGLKPDTKTVNLFCHIT
ncbi:hypothetical protein CEXT_263381 [Caerostris extrusa]|uniref:Uncharacterized protein n=1 Tax=Caerostris extrusa TaxID=172846 RepID=A0AAV4N450_CAEEX|nr:hypothetical protein CEXT_263381 [Caerostris extrusa]